MLRIATTLSCLTLVVAGAAGCGSSGSSGSGSSTAQSSSTTSSSAAPASTTGSSAGALTGEAKSAATGDIPDTQVFLTFQNPSARYTITYPEGWIQKGAASNVTLSNRNNILHIVISSGPAPTPASVSAELTALKQSNSTLKFSAPQAIQLKSGPAVKASYTTQSAPNPVTGKTVLLIVDRYELSHGGKRATVDLGTAKGVDNVDAYRKMINSFTWQ
jgi:hypothetical protein